MSDDEERKLKTELECLNERIGEIGLALENMRRINSGLSSLTINETYKNFYDWKVKPAVDIVALMSSSAANMARVASDFSNNVYSKKREVRKALELSEDIMDEVEIGLELYRKELKCMLANNGYDDLCSKKD